MSASNFDHDYIASVVTFRDGSKKSLSQDEISDMVRKESIPSPQAGYSKGILYSIRVKGTQVTLPTHFMCNYTGPDRGLTGYIDVTQEIGDKIYRLGRLVQLHRSAADEGSLERVGNELQAALQSVADARLLSQDSAVQGAASSGSSWSNRAWGVLGGKKVERDGLELV